MLVFNIISLLPTLPAFAVPLDSLSKLVTAQYDYVIVGGKFLRLYLILVL
jgi:hypothetical protein